MEFNDVIRQRFSCRKFSEKQIVKKEYLIYSINIKSEK